MLRCWDFSETSQTVSLLTPGRGLLRGLAKGARRPKARFSGGFEPITRGQVLFFTKASTELATLTEWDLQEIYHHTRRELRAHLAALYFADVTHHGLSPEDPHPAVFLGLDAALHALADPGRVDAAALLFQLVFLIHTGYEPRLEWAGADGDGDGDGDGAGAAGAGRSGSGGAAAAKKTGERVGRGAAGDRDAAGDTSDVGAEVPGVTRREMGGVVGFDALRGAMTADPGPGGPGHHFRVRGSTARVLAAAARAARSGGLAENVGAEDEGAAMGGADSAGWRASFERVLGEVSEAADGDRAVLERGAALLSVYLRAIFDRELPTRGAFFGRV